MSGEGKVVAVTGASGYIASCLVKMLLDRGYTVKATVRNLNDAKKTGHLSALDGAKERLHLLEADLLEEGSFDPVVEGCDGVFHAASPVVANCSNPQAELIEPAVKGTLNVLRSCAKVTSIKRVVFTGSSKSVIVNGRPLNSEVEIDETWFSDVEFCEKNKIWYALSKTLAEGAASKFAEENGIDLVTIHPGFVIGPTLQPTLTSTSNVILNLIKTGKDSSPEGIYRVVDIRDVCNAHIIAFEVPSAGGRYILVGTITYGTQILKIIHEIFPTLSLPERWKDESPATAPFKISQKKAKCMGINFTPIEVSLKDTVECFREKNFLSF